MCPGAPSTIASLQDFVPLAPTELKAPPEWAALCELKADGWRMLSAKDGRRFNAVSRNAKDLTRQVPTIAAAVQTLPCESAVLDGELCVIGPDGHSRFHLVPRALGKPSRQGPSLTYMAFDLLVLDGVDLRREPIERRKQLLKGLLTPAGPALKYVDFVEGRAKEVFAFAAKSGAEGIVCKRAGSAYEPGAWVKVKCRQAPKLTIGGYRLANGWIAELLVGVDAGDGLLLYVGSVSQGLDRVARQLRPLLQGLHQDESPFEQRSLGRVQGLWVRPELEVVVSCTVTSTGRMRHPVILELAGRRP